MYCGIINSVTKLHLVGYCYQSLIYSLAIIIYYFQLRTAAFKAYCAIWVRRSNFRHQVYPRVSLRESIQRRKVELWARNLWGIWPKCRLPRNIQGSFTCRKATTWDRRLCFPSEGRSAEDFFFALKNPTASAGCEPANLGTKGQHATSRPPKPQVQLFNVVQANNHCRLQGLFETHI